MKRITEIDGQIQKIYEDNANGKLSDDRPEEMEEAFQKRLEQIKSKTA